MTLSTIPQSEQEVIDNFDVELKRIDLDSEKINQIIRENEKTPNNHWKFRILADLSHVNSNSYIVYNGHIIAIFYTHDIRKSELKRLPENLGNLKELLILELIHVRIKKIPTSIGKLKKLIFLRLYYNFDLYFLPESIGELSNLIDLFLKDNNLIRLPESIGNLSELTNINLKNNNITLLPESFKKLNLCTIDLQGNPIRSLSNINFNYIGLEGYCITLKNLTETGRNLLAPWEKARPFNGIILTQKDQEEQYQKYGLYMNQDMERIHKEYEFYIWDHVDMDEYKRTIRDFEPIMKYYEKSPFQLAKQYCNDPNSITDNETGRLIWEANSSVREILEAVFPSDNEIIKKINERLSVELKNKCRLIL